MSQVNLTETTKGFCELCNKGSQQSGVVIITLECQHSFCIQCIKSTQKHKYFIQCPNCKIIDFQDISQVESLLPEQSLHMNYSQNASQQSKTQAQGICITHNYLQEILCVQDLTFICQECTNIHKSQGHDLIKGIDLIKQFINSQTQESRHKVKQAEVKAIDLLNNYYSQLEILNAQQLDIQQKIKNDTEILMQSIQCASQKRTQEINNQFSNQREEFEQKIFILEQIIKRCDKNTENSVSSDFANENQIKIIEDFQIKLKQIEFMRSCYQNKELSQFKQESLTFKFDQKADQIVKLIEELFRLKIEKNQESNSKKSESQEQVKEVQEFQDTEKNRLESDKKETHVSHKSFQEKIDFNSIRSTTIEEENPSRKSTNQTISFGNSLSRSLANSVKSSLLVAEREELEQLKESFQSLDQEYIDNFIQNRIQQDEQKIQDQASFRAMPEIQFPCFQKNFNQAIEQPRFLYSIR